MKFEEVIKYFESIKNDKRSEFTKRIIPNCGSTFGLLTNDVRSYAKKNLDNYEEIINFPVHIYYEIDLLIGIVIALQKDMALKIELLDKFSYKINNWAVCDLIVSHIKCKEEEKVRLFNYAYNLLDDIFEYRARLGYVLILSIFSSEEYIDLISEKILNSNIERKYYVKMAIAWYIQIIYLMNSQKVEKILINPNLDSFIFQKAISKICESKKVSLEEKEKLKKIKTEKSKTLS